ncbi:MAG: ribonuclease III [Alphaproteobacteria bacterium]
MKQARGGRPRPDSAELETALGHRFERPDLLDSALTHPSVAKGEGGVVFQRLEFLGDRVLGLVVADLLLTQFPHEPEGLLARRYAALVRRDTLEDVAREIGLGAHLRLSKGEEEAGGRDNPAILADACEAVIGALYQDGGLAGASAFIGAKWGPHMKAAPEAPQDAKTALQEWAQGARLPLPVYRTVAVEGPSHEPLFSIEVEVEGFAPALGRGSSKRAAEQEAAAALLAKVTAADER